ncbi:MAG: leucine-rich repeat protein, partial [Clostridia bacterium]|nr:leucine-rich repeat protein [Clostridia bacterium]
QATALTEEQMKTAESFVGFDFETYWTIDPTADYPYPTLTGVPHRVTFTVTYKDTDGTVLMTERVRKGYAPSYAAPHSFLLEDEDYVYRFEGWDTDTREVLSDLTVTAVRSKIEKQVLSPIRLTMTVEEGYSRDNLAVDLESMFRRVICTSHTGYRVMSEVTWDMTAYTPDVSGVYVLEGELSLLQSPYYRAEDTTAITLTVTVTEAEDSAAVFRETDLLTEDLEDGTVQIIGYNGVAERVVIPPVLNGKTVTAVADGAFREHKTLLYVSLPVTVLSVGDEAFMGCTALCEAALPEALTMVGARAFYNTALSSVTCGEALTTIGEYAFGFGGDTPAAVSGFTVCGYEDSAAASYAKAHGFGTVTTTRVTDDESGVQAVVQKDVTLVVAEVTGGEAFESATQILEYSDGVKMYDFTVYNTAEERVQPDSMITFSLPIPSAFEAEDCRTYRVNEDGSFKNMNAQILNGRLVFQTSHLSCYAVIDAGEGRTLGDIDGNQTVNMMDAFLLYAAMGGAKALEADALAVSDINGDGTVNMMDALLLYKTASGK